MIIKNLLWQKQVRISLGIALAVVATMVALGLSTGRADAASMDLGQLVPLTRTNMDCFGNLVGTPMNSTFGFALIQEGIPGTLFATVVLEHALPNTTYNVRLIQIPGGANCSVIEGTLTTNAQGNGATFIHETELSGTTGAFLALNRQSDFTDFYTTRDVFLSH
jgi:hypothetical protein